MTEEDQESLLRRIAKRCVGNKHKRGDIRDDPFFQRITSGDFARKQQRRRILTTRDVEAAQKQSALELLRSIHKDSESITRMDPDQIFDDQIDTERVLSAVFGDDLTQTIEVLGETAAARSNETVRITTNSLNGIDLDS